MKRIIALLFKYLALVRAIFCNKRFLNLLIVIPSYLFRKPKFKGLPFLIQIEPTNRCNLRCALCLTGAGKLRRPKGDMSLKEFRKIIDQLEEGTVYLVLYNLGEPLLNSEIYQMVKYAKKKRIFVRLSTNGDFYDKQNIKNLVNCGIDELVISLDCASPQTYIKYKRSDGFEGVIKNVKLIIEERGSRLKPFVGLQLLVTRDTEAEIHKFKEMVNNLGVDKGLIKTLRVNFPGIAPDRDFLPKNNKYIRRAYRNTSENGICYRPWISTLILWDGSVVPCCFDMEGGYTLGNVTNISFNQIWNNQKYISFRKQILRGINKIPLCKECSLRDIFQDLTLIR